MEAFTETANETYSLICDSNLTVTNNLHEDIGIVVDLWMCSGNCKCYSGDDKSIENAWLSYEQDRLYAHNRNTLTVTARIDGEATYPLQWSEFPEDTRNYRQCLIE